MKKTIYVKIEEKPLKMVKKMIKVCAWCPKNSYPKLKKSEEYTHGLCEKHYEEIRIKRDY